MGEVGKTMEKKFRKGGVRGSALSTMCIMEMVGHISGPEVAAACWQRPEGGRDGCMEVCRTSPRVCWSVVVKGS